jgi:light-regulated signal transduction histidine kinase (bacteriophytochrome)
MFGFFFTLFNIYLSFHTHEEYEGTGIGLAIAQKICTSTRRGDMGRIQNSEMEQHSTLRYPCDAR